jgi:hypothetical protein
LHRHISLLVALALASGAAHAEWRASVGFGDCITQNSDLRITAPNTDLTADHVKWYGRGFEVPPWYDLNLVWFPRPRASLGFTAGLLHAKVYADGNRLTHMHGAVDGDPVDSVVPLGNYVQEFSISHGVNFFHVGVVARRQWRRSPHFPSGRWEPFVSLAAGPVLNHPENRVFGQDVDQDYHWNHSWGFLGSVGLHHPLSPRWGVFAEVKRTHVAERVPTATGTATTTLNSTHFGIGMDYNW